LLDDRVQRLGELVGDEVGPFFIGDRCHRGRCPFSQSKCAYNPKLNYSLCMVVRRLRGTVRFVVFGRWLSGMCDPKDTAIG
jgi:hypothetical protein